MKTLNQPVKLVDMLHSFSRKVILLFWQFKINLWPLIVCYASRSVKIALFIYLRWKVCLSANKETHNFASSYSIPDLLHFYDKTNKAYILFPVFYFLVLENMYHKCLNKYSLVQPVQLYKNIINLTLQLELTTWRKPEVDSHWTKSENLSTISCECATEIIRVPTCPVLQNSMIFPGFLVNFQVFFHYFKVKFPGCFKYKCTTLLSFIWTKT